MKAWGNATSAASGERRSGLRALATTLLLGTVLSSACPVLAQVVPGGSEAPRMDAAANGTRIVTINQPSAGGVSSNTYTDFNVGAGGLILNNSAKITSTALAGYIDGNANLKQSGPARVILNQVVSANPSALAGYLEVAGSAAQVIVANANGITCNGCGFINTPFATLTTGAVRRGADGSVAGYDVTRGAVAVGGQGLDARGARLDIFARAVTLNAGLYADRVTVAAGAGSVTPSADNGNDAGDVVVTALKADAAEAAPRFALDVAALGGMYARSIRLIGTEAGLGVRVDGTLASLERGFTLDANGAVQLSGRIVAATDASVRASGDASVSGTLYGGGSLALGSGGAITNGGLVGAGGGLALNAASLASNGTLAAGLGRDGTLGTAGALVVTTSGRLSLAGQVVAPGALSLNGGAIGVASGAQVSGGALMLATAGSLTNAGSIQAAGATSITAGGIENAGGTIANLSAAATQIITGALASRGGTIGGNGDVSVTASSLDLAAATSRLLAGGTLRASVGGATTTTGGGLIQGRGLALTLGSLGNAGGSVLAGDAASSSIAAGLIDNGAGGVIHGDGQALTLSAVTLTNTGSIEHAGSGTLSVTANAAIGNAGGRLATNGALALAAPTLANAGGTISAGGAGSVAVVAALGNVGGTVTAGGPLDLRAGSIANAGGSILATGSGALTLATGGALASVGGTVAGNGDVAITARSIDASGIGALAQPGRAGGNGQISAGGALMVSATGGDIAADNGGLLAAAKTLSLGATGTVHAVAGTLSAGGMASLRAGAVVLDGGILAADTFTIDAGSTSLRRTQIVQTGTADLAIRTAGTLDYSGAIFTANAANLTLQAARIVDVGGQLRHAGTGAFTLDAPVIDNGGGVIATAGTLNLTATTLDNSGGTISAARDATLAVSGSFANAGGVVVAGQVLSLTAGALGNAGGDVEAAGALTARLGSLAGAGGQIKATGADNALVLAVSGGAAAQGGLIGGNGAVSLTAASADLSGTTLTGRTVTAGATVGDLIARGATIQSGSGSGAAFRAGALTLSATGAIDVSGGAINGDAVTLTAARLDTSNGQLTANRLAATLGAITNRGGTIAVTGSAPLTIALAGALDNSGGRLATNASALMLGAGSLANDGGTLTTPGTAALTVTGALANGAGTIAGDGGLAVSADTLTNGGAIGSGAGAATLTAGVLGNAAGGTIYAGQGLTVNAAALTNAGSIAAAGDASLSADTIDNAAASGVIGAGGRLQLGFGDATLGRLAAGGTLAIAARRDWTVAAGQAIVGAHDFTVSVAGALTNAGSIGANGTLSIGASALDNRAGGKLAGDVLTLAVPGAVTNAGLLNAGRSGSLSVGSLVNQGQIFGDALTITATGAIDNSGSAAAIATRAGRLALFSPGAITNGNGALIHSAGALVIAGHDDTGSGFGRVATLTNGSATIEAAGAGLLAADALTNTRTTFTAERVVASSTYVSLPPIYSDSDHRKSERYTDTFSNTAVTADSGESRILFGGDLNVDAGALSNRWSTLSAAGNLTIRAASLENIALAATEFENQSGIYYKEHYVCTDRFIVCFAHDWRPDGTDPLDRDYRTEHGTLTPSVIAAGGMLRVDAGTLANQLLDVDGNVVNAAGALGGTMVAAGSGGALAFAAGSTGGGVATLGGTGAVTAGGVVGGNALTGRAVLAVPTLGGNGALTSVAARPLTLGVVALAGVPSRSASAFQIGLGGLFSFATTPSRGYLIETSAAFTNGAGFLSSDYFLNRVGYDPSRIEQRLGDGYYEQELVGRQLAALTGTTRLAGFADNEGQYRALLDAGATYAKAFDLAPGIGLSAAQMASLTSDLVLLVDVQVQTPTGPQHALAPVVYLSSAHAGGVGNTGALLSSGGALTVRSTGDLANAGTIRGGTAAIVAAGGSLTNAGVVSSAGPLAVTAGGDLVSRAGRFAGSNVAIAAGGNIDLGATSATARSVTVNGLAATTTETLTNNLTSIQAGNSLSVVAGRNLISQGAQLSAGDTATVLAGGSATLGAVNDQTRTVDWAPIRHGATSTTSVDQTAIGTGITGANGVTVAAGIADPAGRLNVSGGTITSGGAVSLSGAGGVLVGAATEHDSAATASYTRKSGFLSTTRTAETDTITRDVAVGSTISGRTVDIASPNGGIGVVGSSVVADGNVNLAARDNIDIAAATSTGQEDYSKSVKKSGLSVSIGGGGLGIFVGTAKTTSKQGTDATTLTPSTIGSTGGNVSVVSDRGDVTLIGSRALAPNGSIGIAGNNVSILAGEQTTDQINTLTSKQTGLTIAIGSPVLGAASTIREVGKAAAKVDDPRLQALAGASAGLAGYNAVTAVERAPTAAGGLSVSAMLGTSSSSSTTESRAVTTVGSQVAAGQDVSLVARGANGSGRLTVVGSDVSAGRDALLASTGAIDIGAAKATTTTTSSSKSSSAGIGVTAQVGAGAPTIGLTLQGSAASGKGNGEDVAHRNAQVTAGNVATLSSGTDLNIRGGVVSANQVVANVGRNLNIESLQDTSVSSSSNRSAGGSLTIGTGVSGSLNLAQGKANSNFASTAEQSGIRAGAGGYQLTVNGNTDLKGGVIASSAPASDNRLATGTLTTSDIVNSAAYKASQTSIGLGYGTVGKDANGNAASGSFIPGTRLATTPQGFSATPPIAMTAKDSASSTTYAAISPGTVTITDPAGQGALTGHSAADTVAALNRDPATASNPLSAIYNPEKIEAAFTITRAFAQTTGQFLADKVSAADTKRAEADAAEARARDTSLGTDQRAALLDSAIALRGQADDLSRNWGAGSTNRQVLAALTAAASGNVSGSTGQFLQSALVGFVQQKGAAYIGDLVKSGAVAEGSPEHAALHAILACAGGAASTGDCGSGALGGAASSLLTGLFGDSGATDTDENRDARANFIASLVTGVASVAGADAATGSSAATFAVENNWLASQQIVAASRELAACATLLCKAQVAGKYSVTSVRQDVLTLAGFGKGVAAAGWSDVSGIAKFLQDPIDGLNGIYSIISDPAVRRKVGQGVVDDLRTKLDNAKRALTYGGDANASQLGYDLGQITYQAASLATLAYGAAEASIKLATIGVRAGTRALDGIAAASARASEAAALRSVRATGSTIGAVVDSEAGSAFPARFINGKAVEATHNAGSNEVVLGKYTKNDPASYERIAESRGSTYFSLGDWGKVETEIGTENMWSINRAFLEQQVAQDKSFVFTADPTSPRAGAFTKLELSYLRTRGYTLIPDGKMFRAIKK